jgi:hypothetical protein
MPGASRDHRLRFRRRVKIQTRPNPSFIHLSTKSIRFQNPDPKSDKFVNPARDPPARGASPGGTGRARSIGSGLMGSCDVRRGRGRRTDGSETRAVPVHLAPSARRGWVGSSGPGVVQDTPCAKAAPDWCFCMRLCERDTPPRCCERVLFCMHAKVCFRRYGVLLQNKLSLCETWLQPGSIYHHLCITLVV